MTALNDDYLDMLRALVEHKVEFMLVGAYALSFHGYVRATEDIDFWIRPSVANARRVIAALDAFGAPLQAHGIAMEDFTQEGLVYQLGLPPRRIDLLTSLSGLAFEETMAGASHVSLGAYSVPVIGRDALLLNKQATGRKKDLLDAERLKASQQ